MPDDLDMIMVDERGSADDIDAVLRPGGVLMEGELEQSVPLRALLPRRTDLKRLRSQRRFNAHTRWGPGGRPKETEPTDMPEYSTVVWYGGKGERMQEQHPARFSGLCVHPNRDGRCAWLFEPNHPAMARPYTFREGL